MHSIKPPQEIGLTNASGKHIHFYSTNGRGSGSDINQITVKSHQLIQAFMKIITVRKRLHENRSIPLSIATAFQLENVEL